MPHSLEELTWGYGLRLVVDRALLISELKGVGEIAKTAAADTLRKLRARPRRIATYYYPADKLSGPVYGFNFRAGTQTIHERLEELHDCDAAVEMANIFWSEAQLQWHILRGCSVEEAWSLERAEPL